MCKLRVPSGEAPQPPELARGEFDRAKPGMIEVVLEEDDTFWPSSRGIPDTSPVLSPDI